MLNYVLHSRGFYLTFTCGHAAICGLLIAHAMNGILACVYKLHSILCTEYASVNLLP